MLTPNDPLALLAALTPHAKSEDDLIEMAAKTSPPPKPGYQPGVTMHQVTMQPTAQPQAQMPQSQGIGQAISPGQPNIPIQPPMTQGESRTRIGQYL